MVATSIFPLNDNPGRVDNPFFPYAWVWVESSTVSGQGSVTTNWIEITTEESRPQRLVQFEFHRNMPGGNQLSVTVLDTTWTLVESLVISAQQKRIRWRYGFANNGQVSPLFEGVIIDYRPDFRIDGVEIQITAISSGCLQPKQGDQQKARVFKDSKGNPLSISDAVIQIAQENGWGAVVDSTAPYYGNDDTNQAMKTPITLRQTTERDLDFIGGYLCRIATREWDNAGNYMFFFEDTVAADGSFAPILHFHPMHFNNPVTHIYTFMRDRASEILSFKPEIAGAAMLGQGAGSVTSFWFDHQTGEIGSVKVDNSNTPDKQILGGIIVDGVPHDSTTENANLQSNLHPAIDEIQARALARINYQRFFEGIQGAILVILGNPYVQPDTIIRVYVLLPNGSVHYTSGDYFVLNITDAVAGGTFTTSMDLRRNASLGGPLLQNSLGDLTQLAVGQQAQGNQ